MRRAIALLGLTLLAAGCGGGKTPTAEGTAAATGRPAADEAKACITAYLGQCGWKEVELVSLADQPDVPKGANTIGEAWAFTFSANYTDVFGERRATENWIAVLTRTDGKPCLKSCFDESRHLVGGHSGSELAEAPAVISAKP
jgi:hypothetical protein